MVKGYSPTQIALHWVVGLLILFNLIFSDAMTEMWDKVEDGAVVPTTAFAWVHIIVGVVVLALVVWRLVLRFARGVPPAPAGEPRLLEMAGHAGHYALYALMIAMPVTGSMAWFGGITDLAELHGELLKSLLWALIVVHVVAGLYHHFIRKDGLLNRMRKPQ